MLRMFVYVLKSLKDKKHYIGCAEDVDKRLGRHNCGRVKSTRHRQPFVVIYKEELKDYAEARKREAELKRMKGGETFRQLVGTRA